jgi:hypothetical protein
MMRTDKELKKVISAYTASSEAAKRQFICQCIQILDESSDTQDIKDDLPLLIARLEECSIDPVESFSC